VVRPTHAYGHACYWSRDAKDTNVRSLEQFSMLDSTRVPRAFCRAASTGRHTRSHSRKIRHYRRTKVRLLEVQTAGGCPSCVYRRSPRRSGWLIPRRTLARSRRLQQTQPARHRRTRRCGHARACRVAHLPIWLPLGLAFQPEALVRGIDRWVISDESGSVVLWRGDLQRDRRQPELYRLAGSHDRNSSKHPDHANRAHSVVGLTTLGVDRRASSQPTTAVSAAMSPVATPRLAG
jgi:hypothetical protein